MFGVLAWLLVGAAFAEPQDCATVLAAWDAAAVKALRMKGEPLPEPAQSCMKQRVEQRGDNWRRYGLAWYLTAPLDQRADRAATFTAAIDGDFMLHEFPVFTKHLASLIEAEECASARRIAAQAWLVTREARTVRQKQFALLNVHANLCSVLKGDRDPVVVRDLMVAIDDARAADQEPLADSVCSYLESEDIARCAR
ncbi:MAG: hypothetical protein KC912_14155 [Proteobacteria bacterium]|nr:hypothetical protein [Pseudomonadota bacterium]